MTDQDKVTIGQKIKDALDENSLGKIFEVVANGTEYYFSMKLIEQNGEKVIEEHKEVRTVPYRSLHLSTYWRWTDDKNDPRNLDAPDQAHFEQFDPELAKVLASIIRGDFP